jgi:hypothetical protein
MAFVFCFQKADSVLAVLLYFLGFLRLEACAFLTGIFQHLGVLFSSWHRWSGWGAFIIPPLSGL